MRCQGLTIVRVAAVGVLLTAIAGCRGGESRPPSPPVRGGIARTPVAAADSGRFAPAAAPTAGALDYLSAYVGKTPGQSGLWATRPLDDRLRALLGTNYQRFLSAIPEVPLTVEHGTYAVASRTAQGVAAVVMDPRADSIYAIEQDGNGRREYLERSIKPPLPAGVRALVASVPLR